MKKLCMDQLIEKLVALLRQADPDKFDDAVAQAKDQITAEQKRVRDNDLEKLFDSQIVTLQDRGTPKQIVENLQNQKDLVLKRASEMTFGDGNILFLPVIPRSFRGPYDLMAMVRNGEKVGHTHLNLNPIAISDVVDAPQELYYIYDVEDGRATLGRTLLSAEEMILKQNRYRHTVAEDMALATHTNVLSHHNLLSTGSRYASASSRVLDIFLDSDGWPWLNQGYVDILHVSLGWGCASCGSRQDFGS